MKKNSQHYRFASFGKTQWYDPPDNFCPYVRKVLAGFGLFMALWSLASWILVWNVYGIALAINGAWSVTGDDPSSFTLMNVWTIAIVLGWAVIFALVYCWAKVASWRDDRKCAKWRASHDEDDNPIPHEPSFFGAWYKSLRDKTCRKIEFTD